MSTVADPARVPWWAWVWIRVLVAVFVLVAAVSLLDAARGDDTSPDPGPSPIVDVRPDVEGASR
ncbi:MAG: hypothetical protein KDB21_05395 [Acidimicrobiales bacterium]|nr:hypothetical protein [Acidimicrobiales bacterium]